MARQKATTMYPRSVSTPTNLPRHRQPSKVRALIKGFDSLTLDPSPRLRALRSEIQDRDVVAEAWMQTGRVIASAMRQQPGSR